MGRSVSYPSGAIVAFRTLEIDDEDDWEWEYECLVEEVTETARITFPSLEACNGWRGREDRILLRNAFADCGISTYCDLVAIWLAERDDGGYWDADAYPAIRAGAALAFAGGEPVRSEIRRAPHDWAVFEWRGHL